MRIGYDAKRAFYNNSGLGNYSRNLLKALTENFGQNKYVLYTSGIGRHLFDLSHPAYETRFPKTAFQKLFPAWWRTFSIPKQLIADQVDIYHGLSHELPVGIDHVPVKTVVTMHDLIFLRYPGLYKPMDRFIYRKKFSYACRKADSVVAVSKQTADDLITFLKVNPKKISLIHQGCNPIFFNEAQDTLKFEIKEKFNLPDSYILYVGTIEPRKNLLTLIKAIHKGSIRIPLVAIGRKTSYFSEIKNYIDFHSLKDIHFIDTVRNGELPAIYQMAKLFVYPSVFEGFGIPVLEALASKIPVITSKGGCFPEAGGPASCYINPKNTDELADAIKNILNDDHLISKMKSEGYNHALQFSPEQVAKNIMDLYKKLLNE